MFARANPSRRGAAAFTLIDQLVAVAIVSGFFAALYALNAQCLYLLNSGRQTTAAQQALQDRMEQLRSLRWSQVTDSAYLAASVMNTASASIGSLGNASETLVINSYPTALSPAIQVTRSASGTVTVNSTNAAVANGDLIRIDATLSWTASPGNRARSVSTTTIFGENTR
jgi:Tfp pilus assembly protein PilE